MASRLQAALDWFQSKRTQLPAVDATPTGNNRPGATHPYVDPIDAKRYAGYHPTIALPPEGNPNVPSRIRPRINGPVTDRGFALPGVVTKDLPRDE